MNAIERALSKRFAQIEDFGAVTPGLQLAVHQRGRLKARLEVGKTYPFYDLASLTKIIFTAAVCIQHFSEFASELDRPVARVLPWWGKATTPRALLTHTAGLEWWVPMYKKLKGPLEPASRWRQVKRELARTKPRRRARAVYSDLDLWMMGAFLEARFELPLLEIWNAYAERLQLERIFFHPGNRPRYARGKYAPTEACDWRGKTLQGEVHDENGWAMGGVAPHTGLFGSLDAVSAWGLELRRAFRDDLEIFGDPKMLRYFVNRRIPRALGDWGLGFMKPTQGRASCGRYFSLRSFGHTGFTGTSLWYDPVRDLQVVILSNRVHPTRANQRFVQLRPRIHDWIVEALA